MHGYSHFTRGLASISFALLAILVQVAIVKDCAGDEPRDLLASIKAEHPRLLFTREMEESIRVTEKSDSLLARLVKQNLVNAEAMLSSDSIRYEIPDGKRLLAQSRKCIERVTAMAFAYRWTGDRKFADGAIREMRIAAQFKDWNPPHFLDTAEMTTALAIGYDWLNDVLEPDDRKLVREAIVRLGLNEGLKVFAKRGSWTTRDNNWNEVCNSGLLMGALAIAEDERELATRVVELTRSSISKGLTVYPPDGAYPEGPSYWHYGTTYTCLAIKALRTALDTDFGLEKSPGLDRTGNFRMHTLGPNDLYFNYADAGSGATPAAAMWILAQAYDNEAYANWHIRHLERTLAVDPNDIKARRLDRFFPLEVAFFKRPSDAGADLPPNAVFRGRQDLATMRSVWNDDRAVYVGFKGGDNRANHGHLDIGSFVLDAGGLRWAVDLGADDYNLPAYFGDKRWTYYRLNNRSHNTLLIDDKLQNVRGVSRITGFSSTQDRAVAIIDMADAYSGQVESANRGVQLVDRRAVQIRDELAGVSGIVRWAMVTTAEIETNGNRAALKQSGKTLVVELLSPSDGQFEVVSTDPPTAAERSNKGTRMLAVRVSPDADRRVTISVVLQLDEPPKTDATAAVFHEPLSSWPIK